MIDIVESMDRLIQQFQEEEVDASFFSITVKRYNHHALRLLKNINDSNPTAGYDYLLRAVISYNIGDYDYSRESLKHCHLFFKNKSVIYYLSALLI